MKVCSCGIVGVTVADGYGCRKCLLCDNSDVEVLRCELQYYVRRHFLIFCDLEIRIHLSCRHAQMMKQINFEENSTI